MVVLDAGLASMNKMIRSDGIKIIDIGANTEQNVSRLRGRNRRDFRVRLTNFYNIFVIRQS